MQHKEIRYSLVHVSRLLLQLNVSFPELNKTLGFAVEFCVIFFICSVYLERKCFNIPRLLYLQLQDARCAKINCRFRNVFASIFTEQRYA